MASDGRTKMKTERTIAFLVARLSSSRLEAKQFRMIGGKPLIQWAIDNLRQSNEIDEIVIATVAEEANIPLREYAEEQGLPCFWYEGDVNHVTTRLRKAAEHFNADICLLISGDCPLVHAGAIDDFVSQMKSVPDADYLDYGPGSDGKVFSLEGVGIYRKKAWQLGDDLSDRPELKEHQFPVIGLYPDLFKGFPSVSPQWLYAPEHRYSVDTPADLEFMNSLHDLLADQGKGFDLSNVLELLKERPELRQINSHVHQRKLVEDVKKVLIAVDSGGGFGSGHLMRARELAQQIVERRGWPVSFLVDDPHSVEMLQEKGLRAVWGAAGRAARDCPDETEEFLSKKELSEFDLVLLDLAPREMDPSWRKSFHDSAQVVAIDSAADWTTGLPLIVIPGVTHTGENPDAPDTGSPLLHGPQYVILRREIRNAAEVPQEKEIDVLAYLPSEERAETIREIARGSGLNVSIVSGREPAFPELMAKSRVFLGNFGYSFYEALALGACPVAWPLTPEHRRDSFIFYDRFKLEPFVYEEGQDLEPLLQQAIHRSAELDVLVKDGTANIVEEVSGLF